MANYDPLAHECVKGREYGQNDTLAHECVKGREYGQNTGNDQATAKLVGHCGLTSNELYGLILFSRPFKYICSLCWTGERLTKIPRPEYDVAYAGKWCQNIATRALICPRNIVT